MVVPFPIQRHFVLNPIYDDPWSWRDAVAHRSEAPPKVRLIRPVRLVRPWPWRCSGYRSKTFSSNILIALGLGPNVSTPPITVMGWRQCLPLSVVPLKGKHCQKLHCCNGVVDTFRLGLARIKFMVEPLRAAVSQGMDGPDNRPKI